MTTSNASTTERAPTAPGAGPRPPRGRPVFWTALAASLVVSMLALAATGSVPVAAVTALLTAACITLATVMI